MKNKLNPLSVFEANHFQEPAQICLHKKKNCDMHRQLLIDFIIAFLKVNRNYACNLNAFIDMIK